MLAALSVVGYAVAFAYEGGYAFVYGYPYQMIRLNLVSVFIAGASLLFIGGYIYHLVDIIVAVQPRPRGPISRELAAALPFVVLWFALVIMFGRHWHIWLWFGILIVVLIGVRLIIPIFTHWSVPGYRAKLEASYQVDQQLTFLPDLAMERFGRSMVGWGILGLAGIALAGALGTAQAIKRERYLVVDGAPPVAVLRIMGDLAVAAPFDPERRMLMKEYHILDLSAGSVILVERRLGKMRTIRASEAEPPRTSPE